MDKCFQCGKPRIQTKQYEELVNGSLVTTTESVCSDPACQKRSNEAISKAKRQRDFFTEERKAFGKYPFKKKQN